jgi:hypothetical protein
VLAAAAAAVATKANNESWRAEGSAAAAKAAKAASRRRVYALCILQLLRWRAFFLVLDIQHNLMHAFFDLSTDTHSCRGEDLEMRQNAFRQFAALSRDTRFLGDGF